MMRDIKAELASPEKSIYDLIKNLDKYDAEKLIKVIQWLKDSGKIREKDDRLLWKQQYKIDF